MFMSLCKKALSPMIGSGYVFETEHSANKYECVALKKDDVRITISNFSYEWTLFLNMYIRDEEVDMNELLAAHGINCKSSYQYYGAGIEKGVDYLAEMINKLVNDIYKADQSGFEAALQNAVIDRSPETVSRHYLEAADKYYLANDYVQALNFYSQAEPYMSELQKKRYEKLRNHL